MSRRNWSYVYRPRPQARRCFIQLVDGVERKRCSGCRELKLLEAFNKGTGPHGLHRHYRNCQKAHRLRKINAGKGAEPSASSTGGRADQAAPGLPSPLHHQRRS